MAELDVASAEVLGSLIGLRHEWKETEALEAQHIRKRGRNASTTWSFWRRKSLEARRWRFSIENRWAGGASTPDDIDNILRMQLTLTTVTLTAEINEGKLFLTPKDRTARSDFLPLKQQDTRTMGYLPSFPASTDSSTAPEKLILQIGDTRNIFLDFWGPAEQCFVFLIIRYILPLTTAYQGLTRHTSKKSLHETKNILLWYVFIPQKISLCPLKTW